MLISHPTPFCDPCMPRVGSKFKSEGDGTYSGAHEGPQNNKLLCT